MPATGQPQQVELPEGKGLVLITDGLFEGHIGRGNERLGEAGLLELARSLAALPGRAFVDALIDAVEERAQSHGGIGDDIAVVRVERTEPMSACAKSSPDERLRETGPDDSSRPSAGPGG